MSLPPVEYLVTIGGADAVLWHGPSAEVWLNQVLATPGCVEFTMHTSATRSRSPGRADEGLAARRDHEDGPPTIPDDGFHLRISVDGQPRRLQVPESAEAGSRASTMTRHYRCRVAYSTRDRRAVIHATWPRFHAVGEHGFDLVEIERYVAGHRY